MLFERPTLIEPDNIAAHAEREEIDTKLLFYLWNVDTTWVVACLVEISEKLVRLIGGWHIFPVSRSLIHHTVSCDESGILFF